jgi:3'-phosphoadenosine 5'-phosphosulfate (PAPS) 3'-phosphatase
VYAGKLAADEISSVFHSGNLGAIDKANKHKQEKQKLEMIEDPQTLADIRGQQVIVGVLGKLFPSVRLIGEEGELMESGDVDDGVDEIIENLKMEQYRGRFSDELKTLVAKDLIVWIGEVYFKRCWKFLV